MTRLWLCSALFSATLVAAQTDIAHPPKGQWVVDRTGRLAAGTVQALNEIAAELDGSSTGQLGVLITDSTHGQVPRSYATAVFNHWGVGHAGSNDGVLLFFALADRKSEIVLGTGSPVKGTATDAVMRDDIVANMKKGALDAAVLSAAKSLSRMLHESRAAGALTEPAAVNPDDTLLPYLRGERRWPDRSPHSWVIDVSEVFSKSETARLDIEASDIYAQQKGRIFFLGVNMKNSTATLDQLAQHLGRTLRTMSKLPTGLIAIDVHTGQASIVLPKDKVETQWEFVKVEEAETALAHGVVGDRHQALHEAREFVQTALVTRIPPRPMMLVIAEGLQGKLYWVLGGLAGLGVLAYFALKQWLRDRPRSCETCGRPRQRLDEVKDDAHLTAAQRTEERIGSVDYDVWWCGLCKDALVLRYGKLFGYSKCPQCQAQTKASSSQTLQYATEYCDGLERVTEKCEHCHYTQSFDRVTERLRQSRSSYDSSSDSGSSSWSSSSFDSSSSSSSSDSSFGGGSSSGDGSSGSW